MNMKAEFISPFLEAAVRVLKTMAFTDPVPAKLGAEKKRIRLKVAGGSQIIDESGDVNIRKRNCLVLRKIFWMHNVLTHSEDVGDNVNRTLSIELSSGKVMAKTSGNEIEEI
jgi:chemotaxis protein CheD